MKKIFYVMPLMAISCSNPHSSQTHEDVIAKSTSVNVETFINEVPFGLNKVKVNDSLTVLIYRGTESCAMIQIDKKDSK